jgi:hypothetical protein
MIVEWQRIQAFHPAVEYRGKAIQGHADGRTVRPSVLFFWKKCWATDSSLFVKNA